MVFVKVVKNKAYFKRYQVQYRRRREGKTDYRARRTMVLQDKTKYGAPKYRLVVRITNRDVVTQIVQAKPKGDAVIMSAYSHELSAFGLNLGLTNYAAAYATGLLLARRTLTKLGIASEFVGNEKVTGEFVAPRNKKDDEGETRFPFRAILDVGIARTTTGARVFGAMKGAVDGGIAVPHKPNRFPGFDKNSGQLNAKAHANRIFGGHVAAYMKVIDEENEENPDEKSTQFDRFRKAGIKPDELEALYKKVHAAIRADPTKRVSVKSKPKGSMKSRSYKIKKLSTKERKAAAHKKVAHLRAVVSKAQNA